MGIFDRGTSPPGEGPIAHPCDAAIRGHVFCSFLALVLRKELPDRCGAAGFSVEQDNLIRHLDHLQRRAPPLGKRHRSPDRPIPPEGPGEIFRAGGPELQSGYALPPFRAAALPRLILTRKSQVDCRAAVSFRKDSNHA